jgi:hypothetical protein
VVPAWQRRLGFRMALNFHPGRAQAAALFQARCLQMQDSFEIELETCCLLLKGVTLFL